MKELMILNDRYQTALSAFKQEAGEIAEHLQTLKEKVDQDLEKLPEEPLEGDDPHAEKREHLTELTDNLDLLISELQGVDPTTADFSTVLPSS